MVGIIIAIIATLVIAVPVSAYVANTRSKKAMEITIGNAEDKAREIIDEAIKAADAKKREASLEVKEETIKARHDFEKETKERRAELQKYEQRAVSYTHLDVYKRQDQQHYDKRTPSAGGDD